MSENLRENSKVWARFFAPGLFFAISAAIVINFHHIAGDVDDVIRELQIRDLLSDKNWFDMQIPAIAMPEPYISHFSRLVDAPYVIITRIMQVFMGQEEAFAFAKFSVPIALLIAFSISLIRVVQYLAGGRLPIAVVVVTPLLIFFALLNFAPNRIDHHNFQIVAMMVMFWGLLTSHRRGGYLIGSAALVSVIVGLECLPFIFIAFLGLIVASLIGDELSLQKLKTAGITLLVLSAPAGWILLGKPGFSSVQCDAYSLPWILGATLGGGVLTGLPLLWRLSWFRSSRALAHRGFSLLVVGAALASIMVVLFPSCLNGPYHMIDPISREFWLKPLQPERSIIDALGRAPFIFLFYTLVQLILAFAIFCGLYGDIKKRNYGIVIVSVIALAALVITLNQMRFSKFSTIFLALFIAKVFYESKTWKMPKKSDSGFVKHIFLWVVPFPALMIGAFALYFSVPKGEPPWDVYSSMVGNDCKDVDFSILGGTKPGRIIAPLGVSLNLLENTYGHQVAATAHHRSSPGIRKVIQVFTTKDTQLRNSILNQFDYIAVCAWDQGQIKSRNDYDPSPAPLYLSLAGDLDWPGLKAVDSPNKNSFRLFKIDHDQLNAVNTAK